MDKAVFINNREKIFDFMEDQSVLFVESNKLGSDDIFKQSYNVNRNYYYLCGIFEFENKIIMIKDGEKRLTRIYINPYNELKAKWVGAPLSKEEVTKLSGIEDVRYIQSYYHDLEVLLDSYKKLYLDIEPKGATENLSDIQLFAKRLKERNPWIFIYNARVLFTKARTIKSKEEIDEMRKAIEITNKGLQNVLAHMGPMYEYQLESYFDQAIKFHGATGYAFPTIAASGVNATCLHYQDNNCMAKDGDLILFDLGASYNMYCSDISRTYPVNGKFSPRQKELYNIVLNGQKYVFENAKPGITTKELNQLLVAYFAKELKRIGLIKEDSEVSKYYYHGVSHHIGLDCHDLCEYTPLKAGSIISNEPGLYIKEENIGIRIEDDVLITETGAEWLSPQIIKEVDEIEEYIRRNRK